MVIVRNILILMALAFVLNLRAQEAASLRLNLAPTITISGLSSGGYMAGQFHIAYSRLIDGAAILGAGPYACARGELVYALGQCTKMTLGGPDLHAILTLAKRSVLEGKLDDFSHVVDDQIFILSGQRDQTVLPAVTASNVSFYRALGARHINYVNDLDAGHSFPTLDWGIPCTEVSQSPWISNCGRDIAQEMLSFLLKLTLNPRTQALDSSLFKFRQDQNIPSMNDYGYVYIPQACQQGAACKIHLAMHGCRQGVDRIQDTFVKHVGINEWAESNNIVVIYPQIISVPSIGNPKGCWDWWGYAGQNYYSKQGVQMRALKELIDLFKNNGISVYRN